MEITQVYSDRDGNSNFENIPITLEEQGKIGYFSSEIRNVKHVHFGNSFARQHSELITVENTVYIIVLEGEFEIEVTSGEKRKFQKGDVLKLDDKTGMGHKFETFGSHVFFMFIGIDN